MKIVKKCAAVAGCILIMSALLGVRPAELFDWKLFLMTLGGAFLLFLPSLSDERKVKPETIGFCALWAGGLETFLLWMTVLKNMITVEELLDEMAYGMRPLFYGFSIFIALTGEPKSGGKGRIQEEKDDTAQGDRKENTACLQELSAEESYDIFRQMGLTGRETEIAIMVCQGMSNSEIAESFCISVATVKKHMSNIFEKMDINRREQIRQRLFENKNG